MASPRQYFTAESLGEVSNTNSAVWTDLVTLTFTPDTSMPYAIFWSCEGKSTSLTEPYEIRLTVDGTAVQTHNIDVKEVVTPVDYRSHFAVAIFEPDASPSSTVYKIQVRRTAAGATCSAKNGRITALRLEAADEYLNSAARATHSTTTFTTVKTLNFTPGSSGDYLIVGYGTMDITNSTAAAMRLHDGTNTFGGDTWRQRLSSTDKYPKTIIWKRSALSGAQTFNIQIAASTAAIVGCSEAVILALRLDGFENNYYAELASDSTSNSTTYVDALTLNATPRAEDHLVLGSWYAQNSSTTISSYTQLLDDATVVTENIFEGHTTSVSSAWMPAGAQRVASYAASSRDWKIQRRAETTTNMTVGGGASSIAVLDLAGTAGYTLTADPGSYAVTGTDAGLKRGYQLAAEGGSYALTATDVILSRGLTITAVSAAYNITGTDVTLTYTPSAGYSMTADASSYVVTGTDALFSRDYRLDAGGLSSTELISNGTFDSATTSWTPFGNCSLSVVSQRLRVTRTSTGTATISADQVRSFSQHKKFRLTYDNFAGTAVSHLAEVGGFGVGIYDQTDTGIMEFIATAALSSVRMMVDVTANGQYWDFDNVSVKELTGHYSVIGTDAIRHRVMIAIAGAYNVTGTNANFLFGRLLTAEPGAYAITGTDAFFSKGVTLSVDPASYIITGTDATFRRGLRLVADPAVYSISGTVVSFLSGATLAAESGTYNITATSAALLRGYRLVAASGAYTIAGTAALFFRGKTMVAAPAAYNITGTPATFSRHYRLIAAPATYTITGTDVVLIGAGLILVAGFSSYLVTGTDVSFSHGCRLAAESGAYSITPTDVIFSRTSRLIAESGGYNLTGTAVNFTWAVTYTPLDAYTKAVTQRWPDELPALTYRAVRIL